MSWPNFASPNVVAVVNFTFLTLIIIIGAVLGATVRVGKELKLKSGWKSIFRTYMIGVGAAFICLPFITSFLHLKYESLVLPLKSTLPNVYIEQLFMLISLSGISSYLGYSLLDNIANKVIQSQVNALGEEQEKNSTSINELREENLKIKKNEKRISIELLYMKAKDAVASGQKFQDKPDEESRIASIKKFNDAIKMLDEALLLVDKVNEYHEYDRLMVMKAYALKRVDRISEALDIVDQLLEKDGSNPVLIYNKGCYSWLIKKFDTEDEIKKLIIKSLTVNPKTDKLKTHQRKIIEKVLSKLDVDIKDLFDDSELENIRKQTM
ncbi:hypothetical protein A3Q29_07015 [Providencia stuartii]|uniref:Uncharacterized protein n=1 Tax=Providencia stuartii TaxID=588 RepID=A0A1S1HMY1_PROST|nr:hypothetical protein A3Q29_07015 [Providencia stuartii]